MEERIKKTTPDSEHKLQLVIVQDLLTNFGAASFQSTYSKNHLPVSSNDEPTQKTPTHYFFGGKKRN